MILLFPLLLILAVVVVRRGRGDPAAGRGWSWFAAWAATGALFTVSLLAGFSIGLFVLPAAAGALLLVARRSPELPEAVGFLGGIGLVLLAIAFINRDYHPCTANVLSVPAGAPVGTTVSCGGFDPTPWLVTGVVVCSLSVGAYAALRHLLDRPDDRTSHPQGL